LGLGEILRVFEVGAAEVRITHDGALEVGTVQVGKEYT
jgi:hypothetical protein